MWQAPNQRVGALASSKKRQLERLSRPMHIRRVRAEVRLVPAGEVEAQAQTTQPSGEIREARVVLNDLSSKGIGIYAAEPMKVHQQITIALEDPKKMTMKGEVVWCREESVAQRILSQRPFKFRVGVKFTFATPEEEAAFKTFCEELEKEHLFKQKE